MSKMTIEEQVSLFLQAQDMVDAAIKEVGTPDFWPKRSNTYLFSVALTELGSPHELHLGYVCDDYTYNNATLEEEFDNEMNEAGGDHEEGEEGNYEPWVQAVTTDVLFYCPNDRAWGYLEDHEVEDERKKGQSRHPFRPLLDPSHDDLSAYADYFQETEENQDLIRHLKAAVRAD